MGQVTPTKAKTMSTVIQLSVTLRVAGNPKLPPGWKANTPFQVTVNHMLPPGWKARMDNKSKFTVGTDQHHLHEG